VSARQVAPYGSWTSPITIDLLLKGTVQMRNQMVRWDGDDLYWSELRPDEAGRIVVCRRSANGEVRDVTPQGFNARSRVHEYGGGSWTVDNGVTFKMMLAIEEALAAANVELPLRIRHLESAKRREEARQLLSAVGLSDFAGSRPHELSGGMRQRVALARALAQDAPILLMDEPFGALDAITRDLLHDELERIFIERNLTILFVTHNAREAVRLGDRVLVFSSRPGRVAAEFQVNLSRPRRLESPDVARLAGLVGDRLREEVLKHGN